MRSHHGVDHWAGEVISELLLLLQAPFTALRLEQAPDSHLAPLPPPPTTFWFQGFPHPRACMLMV